MPEKPSAVTLQAVLSRDRGLPWAFSFEKGGGMRSIDYQFLYKELKKINNALRDIIESKELRCRQYKDERDYYKGLATGQTKKRFTRNGGKVIKLLSEPDTAPIPEQ